MDVLIEVLQHHIANLRKEAALALGEIGSASAEGALRHAADDADPEMRGWHWNRSGWQLP